MVLYCRADSPLRPPDWRWGRARILREGRLRLNRKWDDDWVRRARRFQRRLAGSEGDPRHPWPARVDAPVAGAQRVRSGDDHRLRWEVEARILADQPAGEIAAGTDLPVEVVVAYDALFFDVRGRLECTDWVAACVLGPRLYEGFAEGDVDLIWKLAAYSHGPLALEAVLGTNRSVSAGAAQADGDARLAGMLGRGAAIKAVPVTARTAPRLVALAERLEEIEREARAAGVAAVSGAVRMVADWTVPPALPAAYPAIPPDVVVGLALEDELGASDEADPGLVRRTALRFPTPDLGQFPGLARRTA